MCDGVENEETAFFFRGGRFRCVLAGKKEGHRHTQLCNGREGARQKGFTTFWLPLFQAEKERFETKWGGDRLGQLPSISRTYSPREQQEKIAALFPWGGCFLDECKKGIPR